GEKILQITDRSDGDRASVEYVVGEAEELAAALRDESVHRFVGVEETRPGHPRDFWGEGRRAGAAIKRVVAVPQREPLVVVFWNDRADGEVSGHLGAPY